VEVDEPARIRRATFWLVALSTTIQAAALVAVTIGDDVLAQDTIGRHAFSTLEMALVVSLGVLSWRTMRWSRTLDDDDTRDAATLVFVSLVLCGLGDLVNRNYLGRSYEFDDVIRHSYLITSIWCFLPGYAVAAWANRRVTRRVVAPVTAGAMAGAAGAVGLAIHVAGRDPEVAAYPSTMLLAYTMLLAVLAVSATWLGRAFGWRAAALPIAGAWLAVVADLMIAELWIRRDGYPTIEHANWIVYFVSLAMIQQLPFVVSSRSRTPVLA
jgi:hypothetical protein